MSASTATPRPTGRQEVIVTDIHMPFGSMVAFMVKWAIASIPALIILFVLGTLFWAAVLAIFTGSKTGAAITSLTNSSQVSAHETSAVVSLRDINEAEVIYASSHPASGFTSGLDKLRGEGLIDGELASGRKGGYTFTFTPGEPVNKAIRSYSVTAVPDEVGTTGRRRFYSDEAGEIHYNESGPADLNSPVLGK